MKERPIVFKPEMVRAARRGDKTQTRRVGEESSCMVIRDGLTDSGVNVAKDGNQWYAFGADFIDLQSSTAGWGSTPQDAAEDYIERMEKGLPA